MRTLFSLFFGFLLLGCSSSEDAFRDKPSVESTASYHYLALGDSYTVGESVSNDKSFPAQLRDSLQRTLDIEIGLEIIAVTGWRTDNLQNAVNNGTRRSTYDLVTLLIGVNNQFQNRTFGQYEKEFPELLEKAIAMAKGQPENVLVVSIPDYAFTPFGQQRDMEKISREIDAYNAYAASVADSEGVSFVNITDITRKGLEKPSLVANDGLHPSGEAYRQFVERIFPMVSALFN